LQHQAGDVPRNINPDWAWNIDDESWC